MDMVIDLFFFPRAALTLDLFALAADATVAA
jgi:hypothetical protein